jgi:DNA-binding response OmpR family regulator
MRVANKILVVDDDVHFVEIMKLKLERANYEVDITTSGEKGYSLAKKQSYDLVILDVTMPGKNGIEICKDLRHEGIITPILILSGQSDKSTIVTGLEVGADDYLTKPFEANELLARIKAMLRRNQKNFDSRLIRQGQIELDMIERTIRCGQRSQALTTKEASLLSRLMNDPSHPVPRESLLKDVWGIDNTHTSNRLDVYIRRLRQKLEDLSGEAHIQTLRGSGYYFDIDDIDRKIKV